MTATPAYLKEKLLLQDEERVKKAAAGALPPWEDVAERELEEHRLEEHRLEVEEAMLDGLERDA
jgi:hypothetical protein